VSFIDSEIKENKKQSLKVLVPKEDSGNIKKAIGNLRVVMADNKAETESGIYFPDWLNMLFIWPINSLAQRFY